MPRGGSTRPASTAPGSSLLPASQPEGERHLHPPHPAPTARTRQARPARHPARYPPPALRTPLLHPPDPPRRPPHRVRRRHPHRRDRQRPPPPRLLQPPGRPPPGRCNNRRTTRCPACAEVYRRDTFHLITSGLRGGRASRNASPPTPASSPPSPHPASARAQNRPSGLAGSVRRCRCGVLHDQDDAELGTPLNPDTLRGRSGGAAGFCIPSPPSTQASRADAAHGVQVVRTVGRSTWTP